MVTELARASLRELGLGEKVRKVAVELAVASERVRFSLTGRPEPSAAIVVAGSGRSGTTWLADLLGASLRAQQIFEPLNPWRSAPIGEVSEWNVDERSALCLYLDAEGVYPEWESFLRQVLRGAVRGEWTDFSRTRLFPKRYLLKTVRANLMLGYLYDKFQPHIVYLVRHPCAVIHSRMEVGWQADVRHILRQKALTEAYLRPWVAEIEMEQDPLGAHAVWWAVENFVAGQELATRPHVRVAYEELCLEPERAISGIGAWLEVNLHSGFERLIRRPSRTARSQVAGGGVRERLSGWKKYFTREDEKRIIGWAERFNIPYYDGPLPAART